MMMNCILTNNFDERFQMKLSSFIPINMVKNCTAVACVSLKSHMLVVCSQYGNDWRFWNFKDMGSVKQ